MSLFSTFYSGAAAVIETSIKEGKVDLSGDASVKLADFSGGLAQPYLFPDDFAALTGGGVPSFWNLMSGSVFESEEHGLYRVPHTVCERLLALSGHELSEFSHAWSARRAEAAARSRRDHSIWRSAAFWKITGGGAAGLLIASIMNRGDSLSLMTLAGWLLCTLSVGVWLDTSQRRRWKKRRRDEAVDWVAPLKHLQHFLAEARERGSPVYYYWSL